MGEEALEEGRPIPPLLPLVLAAALAMLASAASGQESGAPLSPTIRPILTSNDPAGDDLTVCYVLPATHQNGTRDSPDATPGACVVEITDTLAVQVGLEDGQLGSSNAAPSLVVDVLLGPQNEAVTLASRTIDDMYLRPGTRLGVYRFRGHVGAQAVVGGFTIRPSSKRVLQLRYANEQQGTGAYVALAGYPPFSPALIDVYRQISFRPAVSSGQRKWRYAQTIGRANMDARGEALFRLPFDVHSVPGSFLVVTEPVQENDLSSGRRIADDP